MIGTIVNAVVNFFTGIITSGSIAANGAVISGSMGANNALNTVTGSINGIF